MPGLLSPDEQSQINNDALMGLGMGLLSASGPSRVPVSMGQAMGMGMQGFQQGKSQAEMMAYKKKMMEQEAQQHAFQQQLMQMQLAEAQRQNQIRTNAGEYMKGLDPEAQQYAAATGDFKGAFELHRQKQFSNLVGGAMGGQQQEAPRPFQDQVKPGQFQVTDENQANTLIADLKKLEAVNPQEAAKVRESLVQQGLIRPPMQQVQPDVDTLARLGALGSMQGIKGADKLIEYAKFSKPEWATLDSGNALYGYNKNSQTNPFGNSPIVKQMSPDAVASNALGRDRLNEDMRQHDNTRIPIGYERTGNGLRAIPGGPADAKTQALEQTKLLGKSDVELAVSTLRDAYDRLEKGGGITSTAKGAVDNAGAYLSSSGMGQSIGKMLGTNNQSARNDIAMTRPALLGALMKATGMSAKQMDSNAELKLWLATATDPTLDVESNRRALDKIEKKYLSGTTVNPPASGAKFLGFE